MPPHALGDDMDVPFMSWVPRRVQFGTEAMAPPGALMLTPRAPSVVGPLDDQVYWLGGSFSRREYSATIMSGVTYAPTPEKQRTRSMFLQLSCDKPCYVVIVSSNGYIFFVLDYLWHWCLFPLGSQLWRDMGRCSQRLRRTSRCAFAQPPWSLRRSSWNTRWQNT